MEESDMGYYAIRTLLPAIMEWVDNSRIRKSLPEHPCEFLTQLGNASVQINLSNLSKEYLQKHIEPNFQNYCDAFTEKLKPVLKKWCIKCNMTEVSISLRFKAHFIYGTDVHITVSREELKKYHNV